MRIETIGKRRYAFGLTWADSPGKPGRAERRKLRKTLDPAARAGYYTCTCQRGRHYVLGGGVAATRLRGSVYSYAASLALHRSDGLYVVRVDAEHLWFTLIRNELVVPETDLIDTDDKVLESVELYRRTLGLDNAAIFAGEDVPITDAQRFDAERAVTTLRNPAPLQLESSQKALKPVVATAAALIAVAVGAKLYNQHRAAKSQRELTTQQHERTVQAYRRAVRAALSGYARDPAWIEQAWRTGTDRLPAFFAGWTLRKMNCNPSGCDGEYVHDKGLAVYAIAPFQQRFGAQVSIHPNADGLRVHVPLSIPTIVVNEGLLRRPPAKPAISLMDWMGLAPLHIAGLAARPTGAARNLAAAGGRAAGYPSLMLENVTVKGKAPVGASLPSVLAWSMAAKFRITHLSVATGYPNASSQTWEITALRIHG